MAKQYFNLDELVYAEKPKNRANFRDLENQQFGKLKVLGYAGRKKEQSYWYCLCDCGKIVCSRMAELLNGKTKTCGCRLKAGNLKHGKRHTPEYGVYYAIYARCNNPKNENYHRYGGRGIELRLSFEEFLNEIGERPSPLHSIERIDNEGHYDSRNLRWATMKEQSLNRCDNRILEYEGKLKTQKEWAEELNISQQTISSRRLKGYCVLHQLSLKIGSKKPKNCPNCK